MALEALEVVQPGVEMGKSVNFRHFRVVGNLVFLDYGAQDETICSIISKLGQTVIWVVVGLAEDEANEMVELSTFRHHVPRNMTPSEVNELVVPSDKVSDDFPWK